MLGSHCTVYIHNFRSASRVIELVQNTFTAGVSWVLEKWWCPERRKIRSHGDLKPRIFLVRGYESAQMTWVFFKCRLGLGAFHRLGSSRTSKLKVLVEVNVFHLNALWSTYLSGVRHMESWVHFFGVCYMVIRSPKGLEDFADDRLIKTLTEYRW